MTYLLHLDPNVPPEMFLGHIIPREKPGAALFGPSEPARYQILHESVRIDGHVGAFLDKTL